MLSSAYNTVGQIESSEFPLKENMRYMVNPGSVGQPRDGDWRAAFAVFDSDARIVTFYRVPYNLKRRKNASWPPTCRNVWPRAWPQEDEPEPWRTGVSPVGTPGHRNYLTPCR